MISSFADQGTEDIFNGDNTKAARKTLPADLWATAQKRLSQLEYASAITDMRLPPGNKLEALKGDMAGKFSVRINDQYRMVFEFAGGNATNVQITDYH
jgi:proteic killer suppression protein